MLYLEREDTMGDTYLSIDWEKMVRIGEEVCVSTRTLTTGIQQLITVAVAWH